MHPNPVIGEAPDLSMVAIPSPANPGGSHSAVRWQAGERAEQPNCLNCHAPLTRTLVDLGLSPLANNYVSPQEADIPDAMYPLHARVCDRCLLVQVDVCVSPEKIFTDYAYFSSCSESWLAHCRAYVSMAVDRFHLGEKNTVLEIASNDGYMLQYFVERKITVLGIEPAANVAAVARRRGVPTEIAFFGTETACRLAARGVAADLLAAKNVLGHVPDINDFLAGIALLLKPDGVFTVEFPHLLKLIRDVQFDTIYHEHFTYLSLVAIEGIFERHGLRIFEIQEIDTHGGSLRLFACLEAASHLDTTNVELVRQAELAAKLDRPEGYANFEPRVQKVRHDLIHFLHQASDQGRKVVGYGAAAKGNTLLNYCGIGPNLLPFIGDISLAKQSKLSPGARIPIRSPQDVQEARPDYLLILPWNLRPEIQQQLAVIREWGGRFVTAIPQLKIF